MKRLLFAIVMLLSGALVHADELTEQQMVALVAALFGNAQEQDTAVAQLVTIGMPAIPYVAPLARDKQPDVKAAAWRVIDGVGFQNVVVSNIQQLSSTEEASRLQATETLAALTNKYFGYSPQDTPEKRAEIIAKWDAWLVRYIAEQAQN